MSVMPHFNCLYETVKVEQLWLEDTQGKYEGLLIDP